MINNEMCHPPQVVCHPVDTRCVTHLICGLTCGNVDLSPVSPDVAPRAVTDRSVTPSETVASIDGMSGDRPGDNRVTHPRERVTHLRLARHLSPALYKHNFYLLTTLRISNWSPFVTVRRKHHGRECVTRRTPPHRVTQVTHLLEETRDGTA